MNSDKMKVVGLGEILWDVLPEGKKLGGAPANFAYHAAQLGLESMVVSAIGQDQLGDEILAVLDERELPYLLPRLGHPTGRVDVILNEEGIPSYKIQEDVAWDHIPLTSELLELARETEIVCFGSLAQRSPVSRETIRQFLKHMPEDRPCYKIFDINLRQHYYDREVICSSLELSNVLKINDEELELLQPLLQIEGATPKEQAHHLLKAYQLELVILTAGAVNSSVYSLEEQSTLPTPEVAVVDTVGAGDSFTASFVAALTSGFTIREAHQRAVDVAAYVCSQHGAMPKLPEELLLI